MKWQKIIGRKSLICILSLLLAVFMIACNNDTATKDNETTNQKYNAQPTPTEPIEAEPTPTEATELEPTPTESAPIEYQWPEDFSLFEAYEDEFLLGTIYTDAARNQDKELILKHFNAITPENLMKPEYMQPREGSFSYNSSDTMVKFAEDNGLYVVGHTLAWHQQSGKWMGVNVTKEEGIEQLKSHISNVAGKYKGRIIAWDVVNEAILDGVTLPADGDWTKCLRGTQWLNSIGPEYMALAFTFAHEADPDAKLYYNDYNLNNKSKADIVYAMVKDLKEQGIPIDGIGMQGHYSIDTSIGSVEYSLSKFSELDLEISITELDVGVTGASRSGLTKEQEITQGIKYAELFKLYKEYSDSIERVTFWGYVDNKSWRNENFPCLFNADKTPKEAAYAVLNPEIYLEMYKTETIREPRIAKAKYGTPKIDAEIDELWNSCEKVDVNSSVTAWEGAKGALRVLWDESFIYVLFEVNDSVLNKSSQSAHEQDSVEIFLDQKNDKKPYYDENDGQYRVNYEGRSTFGSIPDKAGFTAKAKKTDKGYLVEMAIPLLEDAKEGLVMGFDAQINDSNGSGVRQSIAKFNDITDNSWQSTELWGNLVLEK